MLAWLCRDSFPDGAEVNLNQRAGATPADATFH
jgi:hypothetical protein